MTNRVCILIPVYNDPKGLLDTLKSIETEESFCNFDVLVVDDGSSEPIVIEGFKFNAKLLRNDVNRGIEYSLRRGVSWILKSGYDFVSRIDSGDLWVGPRLEKQMVLAGKGFEIIGGKAVYIDGSGSKKFLYDPPLAHSEIRSQMNHNPAFLHPCVTISAEALRKYGNYSNNYTAAEDYELFYRLIKEVKGANLNSVVCLTLINDAGISSSKRRQQLMSKLRVQFKHGSVLDIQFYLGIARTIASICIPYNLIQKAKGKVEIGMCKPIIE